MVSDNHGILYIFASEMLEMIFHCVTMSNVRNIIISDGCAYPQTRKGLGMHLVTYTNRDTVPFLLLVQYKGGLSEIEFTVTLFSNACMIFFHFSRRSCAFLPI